MAQSSHGMVTDDKGEMQPADKTRAQTAHNSDSRTSATREATCDPKLNDAGKTPGSGMAPDDQGSAPSG